MSQYNSLFNNTRIPMTNKDILHSNPTGKHIVVMRRGNFYKFDVLNDQGILYVNGPSMFACNSYVNKCIILCVYRLHIGTSVNIVKVTICFER